MSRRQRPRSGDPHVIQFPRLRNGEVDWKTLGNVLVAQVLGDALYISYVDPKYGKKDTDFEVHTQWRYSHEKDEVVVLKKELEDSPIHYFAGCSVIKYPPQAVFDEIGLSDNILVYEKYAEESRVVELLNLTENSKDCIVHRLYAMRNCLFKAERETLYFKHAEYLPNMNKYVIVLVSVEHQNCPVSDIKRAQLLPGCGCVLEPYNNDPSMTRITWIVHIDLGGLPAFITNHIMKQEPFSIRFISEHLSIRQREGALNEHKPSGGTEERTTPELPTPGTTREEVRFSSISVGSNPLYQHSWSMSARTPGTVFCSKVGSEASGEQQNLPGVESTTRKISTVIEEPEKENDSVVVEQSSEQKDQSLMFEVSMQTKRSGLTVNLA